MLYLQAVKLSTDWMIFSIIHFETRVLLRFSFDPLSLFPLQLHNAANTNQKEKYEADLKKEIKKLQVRKKGNQKIKVFPLTGWLRCSGLPQS